MSQSAFKFLSLLLTLTHTLSLAHSLSHTHTLSLSHSLSLHRSAKKGHVGKANKTRHMRAFEPMTTMLQKRDSFYRSIMTKRGLSSKSSTSLDADLRRKNFLAFPSNSEVVVDDEKWNSFFSADRRASIFRECCCTVKKN